ncbi:hypothetical protein V8B55DRAFT_1524729 [Mucor lusitanicus]
MSFNNNSGGFMDNSYDNSNNTQNGSGYTKKPLGEQTLRPLTIKQIKTTYKSTIPLLLRRITFVAVIRTVQELATNFVYTVEDGTGVIDVRKWTNDDTEMPGDADLRRELLPDTYVRINGRINSFSSRISVVGHALRPITDFNELSYHFLDCINTHLLFTKPGSSQYKADNMQIDGPGAPTSLNDKVSQAIKEFDSSEEGASIDQLVQKFRGMHTESEIRDSIDYLMTDGQCYTTIDSEHLKSCLP